MKRIFYFLAVIILIVGCNSQKDKNTQLDELRAERAKIDEQIRALEADIQAAGGSTEKLIPVVVSEIKPEGFEHFIEIQGRVDGDENIALSSKTAGFITSIRVVQGQRVVRGQLLATFDDQIVLQTLKELESTLEFAKDIYQKQKNLWDQGIGSEVQYLKAKNDKESLENRISTIKEQLDMLKIRSPINGTVEEIPVKLGQFVAPGMPAFRVVNFTHIKVLADIAESYSARVKSGDSVLVYFPDFDTEVKTSLSFTSKFISPINRTFQVECRLNPGKMEYRANMIAVVKIQDYKNDEAIVLPVNIVQKSMSETFVFIASEENGKKIARRRDIKVGQDYNGMVEIISGLKIGDKVITVGYQDLIDGQQVKI